MKKFILSLVRIPAAIFDWAFRGDIKIFILILFGISTLIFIRLFRYEMFPVAYSTSPAAYRLDRWTGQVMLIKSNSAEEVEDLLHGH